MSNIDFRFNHLSDKNVYVPLMHKVTNISKNSNFTTGDRFATVWSKIFASWTTDEVIMFIRLLVDKKQQSSKK